MEDSVDRSELKEVNTEKLFRWTSRQSNILLRLLSKLVMSNFVFFSKKNKYRFTTRVYKQLAICRF